MTGWPNSARSYRIIDYPASYHNFAGGFSFADGHAEIRKWLDPRTTPILNRGVEIPLDDSSPGNIDVSVMHQLGTATE